MNLTKRQNFKKENQTEILELKNTMNKMKNVIESITSRLDQAEGRICALEDRNFEIFHSEENTFFKMKEE